LGSSWQVTVELIIFHRVSKFDSELLGTNEPTVGQMRESYYLRTPFTKGKVDITIIVGRPSNDCRGHYPLLLLRFWKDAVDTSRVDMRKFYIESVKLIPRDGVSVTRLGGSSGTIQHNSQKQLFEFLARPGSFPRKASGVKFVQRPLYLQCLYISPYSGQATHRAKYSPVHDGGAFKPTPRLVKVFPFLYDFAEAKVISALLLDQVNKKAPFLIHQAAVEKEVGVIAACDCTSRKLLLRDFINRNTHTIVAHPVGYHQDTFSGQQHSLENKMCFVVPKKRSTGMGRGGAGPTNYVVALLDW
jgi:hypothetical protein